MFIPCPDSALVVASFMFGTMSYSNTFWFVRPDFTMTDLTSLAEQHDYWFGRVQKGLIHSGHGYQGCTAYDMRDDEAQSVYVNTHAGAGGQVTAEALPIQTALVATLRTQVRGRTGRGRLYLTGYVEAQLSGGQFTSTHVNNVKSMLNNMKANLASVGWVWVVMSRHYNGEPREEGVARPVWSVVVRSALPGTQRRRMDRP